MYIYISAKKVEVSYYIEGNKVEDYKQVFSLTAGVTKMRIYMWIEGQDIDCENYATGASISYNLQFAITD